MFKGEDITFLEVSDFMLVPIYLFFLLILAYWFRNIKLRGSPLKKYFIPGMMVKVLGGIGVGLVYGFYYKGGDTFYYYYDSMTFNHALKDGIGSFFRLLFLPANTLTLDTYEYTRWLTFFRDPSGWMTDKIYGVISLFSFHSYPVMAVLVSFLSFTGAWALYKTFALQYPDLNKPLAICVLFVPSVFFWGSGVLKDSITFGCLGWITYCSYLVFFKRRNVIRNGLMLFCTGYIALQVKPYIVISFLPALMFWIFLTYRSRIPNQFLRVISGPSVFLASLGFGYILVKRIGEEFSQFALKNVLNTAQTFHQWHSYLAKTEDASGYSLGSGDGTWQSVLAQFPAAVNVTLFRPYLWEANSAIMLASALESTFILSFSIYILWRNGIRRTFGTIWQNPTIFFCFFFSMIFAFAVGFTSYNFGALVRFKIPCLPFYLIGLVVLNDITSKDRKRIEEERSRRRPAFEMRNRTLESEPAN